MSENGILDAIPLWLFFVATLLLVLASIEAGYGLGTYRRRQAEHESETPVGAMVAATLGLLAFILAFTFGLAAARFDTRRQVVLDEANAVGTTYLRAEMLPARGDEIRALLRTYVDTRLRAVTSGDIDGGLRRSEDLQNQLWAHATAVAVSNPGSIIVGLFIQSLNELIDLHATRVMAGLRSRIPAIIWVVLFAMTTLSLGAMGYHAGLVGTNRSIAVIAVAVAFSSVIFLIADLDRPGEGTLQVSQQALVDVQRSMQPAATAP